MGVARAQQPAPGRAGSSSTAPPSHHGAASRPADVVEQLDQLNASLGRAHANARALFDLSATRRTFDKARANAYADNLALQLHRAKVQQEGLSPLSMARHYAAAKALKDTPSIHSADGDLDELRTAIKDDQVDKVNQVQVSDGRGTEARLGEQLATGRPWSRQPDLPFTGAPMSSEGTDAACASFE